jgi:hypothetical protein
MAVFIIDLDGTIADDRERKLRAGPEPDRENRPEYLSWLSYIQSEATLAVDSPVPGMPTLLRGIARESTIIVYLTAREEKYREVTKEWLSRHNFPRSLLLMRPNDSWLSSSELKRAHILEIMDAYKGIPVIAIDDDGSGDCAQMYLELGIPHLHMKLAPLQEAQEEEQV